MLKALHIQVMDDDFAARLHAAKNASVAQLLMRCARLLNEQAVDRVPTPAGAPRLRPSHTALFPHIDLAGTRSSEIARRMGISKQAVGQLVAELEQMGAVERTPDPADGRARLVRFSQAPGRGLMDGLKVLMAFEQDLAEDIGDDLMGDLKYGLQQLQAALEKRAQASD